MKQRAHTFDLLKIAAGLLSLLTVMTVPSGVALAGYFNEEGGPRIASVQGETFVRGGGQQEWGYAGTNTVLEDGDQVLTGSDGQLSVEYPGGVFLELQPRSRARISSIGSGPQLRLDYGTFNVVLLQNRPDRNHVRVDWARGGVDLTQGGSYRVDVHRDGLARVTVLRGDARVRSASRRTLLSSGQDLYVDRDGSFGREGSYVESNYDDFDRGILNRYFGSSAASLPRNLSSFIVGALDLARSGDWVRVPGWTDYGWRPRNVEPDWRPYSNGRWVFTRQGWTWVPDEAWGYAPSHYGHWDSVPGMGWVWQPGKKYRPAWVRWVHEGDFLGWAPIGPDNRVVQFRRGGNDESFMFYRRDDLRDGKRVKVQFLKKKHGKFVVFERPDRFVNPTHLAKMKGMKTKQGRMEAAVKAAKRAEEVGRKGDAKEEERARHEAKGRKAKLTTPAQKAGREKTATQKPDRDRHSKGVTKNTTHEKQGGRKSEKAEKNTTHEKQGGRKSEKAEKNTTHEKQGGRKGEKAEKNTTHEKQTKGQGR